MPMRKPLLIGAVAALLLVAAGGGVRYVAQRDGVDDLVYQKEPLYYTFSTPFTVNVKETDAMIQATVAINSHYATTIETVKTDEPALRNQVILALSGTSEASAATDAGKQQLEQVIADALNRQLKADGYSPTIDAAYFSDFIIQGNDDGG